MAQININENNAFASMSMDEHNIYTQEGLTKREYLAAMAMQGLLVNYSSNGQHGNNIDYPMVSDIAVRCADDLLAELNK